MGIIAVANDTNSCKLQSKIDYFVNSSVIRFKNFT